MIDGNGYVWPLTPAWEKVADFVGTPFTGRSRGEHPGLFIWADAHRRLRREAVQDDERRIAMQERPFELRHPFTALVGRAGSGKTYTLHQLHRTYALSGVRTLDFGSGPDSGDFRIGGIEVALEQCRGRRAVAIFDRLLDGWHPADAGKWFRRLKAVCELYPELQVVFTTNSPDLVSCVSAEAVWLCVRGFGLGSTPTYHRARLADHPDVGEWKDGTLTGELWGALGEDWVPSHERDLAARGRAPCGRLESEKRGL